jgi:hypothetical protein
MSLRQRRDELDAKIQHLERRTRHYTPRSPGGANGGSLHESAARLNALAGWTDEIAFEFDTRQPTAPVQSRDLVGGW